jgi:hypothetical protein
MNTTKINCTIKSGWSEKQAFGREIIRQISRYVWEKYTDGALVDETADYLPKVHEVLDQYGITDCIWDTKTGLCELKTYRPGIVIGVKGENIYKIEAFLKKWVDSLDGLYQFNRLTLKEDLCPLTFDIHDMEHKFVAMSSL